MENDLLFRGISAVLFLVVWSVRKYYERLSAQVAGQGLAQDRDDKRIIVLQSLLLAISLIALLVYIVYPPWLSWSILALPEWVRWLGALLGALGTVLLVWSHRALGRNFFGGMKIREGHELVESGPYRWVRHPIYTAFIALGIGLFLLTGSWMVGAPWLASIGLALATRMGEEEAMMAEQFGESYERYKARTGRFLPRLRQGKWESDGP